MNTKNFVVLFVLAIALLLVPAVSAQFAPNIQYVETEGVEILNGQTFSVEAGQTLNIRVVFSSNLLVNEEDARVYARVLGVPGVSDTTERFDVLPNGTYSKQLRLEIPSDIDPDENFILEVRVESQNSVGSTFRATFAAQRKNYALEFLSVESPSKISAGEILPIEFVIENRGRNVAEDTFVIAGIPQLNLYKKIFLEDLSAYESTNNEEEEDALEGRIMLAIPAGTAPGLYTVEIKAMNDDSEVVTAKRVEISSSNANSAIVATPSSRTFSAGANGRYALTIVNSGNKILVYNLVTESEDGLNVDLEDSVVVVPAGSSKSVDITASSSREGTYDFKVTVLDADNSVVAEKSFNANVEGRAVGGNAAVVLTIILAIVFVVLLVVLIVLLTRKPAKADSEGESYY